MPPTNDFGHYRSTPQPIDHYDSNSLPNCVRFGCAYWSKNRPRNDDVLPTIPPTNGRDRYPTRFLSNFAYFDLIRKNSFLHNVPYRNCDDSISGCFRCDCLLLRVSRPTTHAIRCSDCFVTLRFHNTNDSPCNEALPMRRHYIAHTRSGSRPRKRSESVRNCSGSARTGGDDGGCIATDRSHRSIPLYTVNKNRISHSVPVSKDFRSTPCHNDSRTARSPHRNRYLTPGYNNTLHNRNRQVPMPADGLH